MARDATQALGTRELAGTFVHPQGWTKRMTMAAAGKALPDTGAGMAVAAAVLPGPYAGAPQFGTIGYVAVTQDELALVRGKTGLMKPKVGDEVVARVPRSEVHSAELEPQTLKAALRIRFANGGSWEFEVPKIYRKTAAKVVAALLAG